MSKTEKKDLLLLMRQGAAISGREQIRLIVQLSLPAIMAQLSHIVMQYIDASMVGRLGSAQSASIGLMASSTWLFSGLCQAAATGFTVQIAQHIGAGEEKRARSVMMQAFVLATGFSAIAAAVGAGLSGVLPAWLGGESGIRADASAYFLVYALSLPFVQLNNMAGGALQASGNMRVPSVLQALMCLLDVIFNALLIFPGTAIGGAASPRCGAGRVRRGAGYGAGAGGHVAADGVFPAGPLADDAPAQGRALCL